MGKRFLLHIVVLFVVIRTFPHCGNRRVLSLIFVIVVIVGRTEVDGVEQDSDDFRIHLGEDVARPAKACFVVWPERMTRPRHRHGEKVRRHPSPTVTAACRPRCDRTVRAAAPARLACWRRPAVPPGFGGGVPAGSTNRLGRMVLRVMACSRRRAAGQHVAKSAAWAHAQSLVNAGTAQIGVNQQHPHTFLRQHDRAVDAGGGLALLRQRAGHHDDFRRRTQIREQQGSAQARDRIPPSATAAGPELPVPPLLWK